MSVDFSSAFHTHLHTSPCRVLYTAVVHCTLWAVEAIFEGGFDSPCFLLHTVALELNLHQRLAPLLIAELGGYRWGTVAGVGAGWVWKWRDLRARSRTPFALNC